MGPGVKILDHSSSMKEAMVDLFFFDMLTREGFGLVGGWFVGRERKRSDVGSESEIRGGFRRMDSEDVQEEGREDAVWFKKDEEEKEEKKETSFIEIRENK